MRLKTEFNKVFCNTQLFELENKSGRKRVRGLIFITYTQTVSFCPQFLNSLKKGKRGTELYESNDKAVIAQPEKFHPSSDNWGLTTSFPPIENLKQWFVFPIDGRIVETDNIKEFRYTVLQKITHSRSGLYERRQQRSRTYLMWRSFSQNCGQITGSFQTLQNFIH